MLVQVVTLSQSAVSRHDFNCLRVFQRVRVITLQTRQVQIHSAGLNMHAVELIRGAGDRHQIPHPNRGIAPRVLAAAFRFRP